MQPRSAPASVPQPTPAGRPGGPRRSEGPRLADILLAVLLHGFILAVAAYRQDAGQQPAAPERQEVAVRWLTPPPVEVAPPAIPATPVPSAAPLAPDPAQEAAQVPDSGAPIPPSAAGPPELAPAGPPPALPGSAEPGTPAVGAESALASDRGDGASAPVQPETVLSASRPIESAGAATVFVSPALVPSDVAAVRVGAEAPTVRPDPPSSPYAAPVELVRAPPPSMPAAPASQAPISPAPVAAQQVGAPVGAPSPAAVPSEDSAFAAPAGLATAVQPLDVPPVAVASAPASAAGEGVASGPIALSPPPRAPLPPARPMPDLGIGESPRAAPVASVGPSASGGNGTGAVPVLGPTALASAAAIAAAPLAIAPVRPRAGAAETRAEIAQVLSELECARVSASLAPNAALHLSGHVPSEADRAQLTQILGTIPGVGSVAADALILLPRPHCGTLERIAALGIPASADQAKGQPPLGSSTQVGTLRFRLGQSVRFQLKSPDFPAYVYVDYYDADGDVVHLLPNSAATANRFSRPERFQIGGQQGLDMRVGPPYGLDLVVAIAASEPLFPSPRPIKEPAANYLRDLDAAFSRARSAGELRSEHAYLFVHTSP